MSCMPMVGFYYLKNPNVGKVMVHAESAYQLMREMNGRILSIEDLEPTVVLAALMNARQETLLTIPAFVTPDWVTDAYKSFQAAVAGNASTI